ncbi:B12-binding domain-containing radical SAM protein [Candidatus Pacearchaeota archaeon]|nr:B12-binding domain-containing radical SAM protein [Candidatus Pacearchaeota archaeon]
MIKNLSIELIHPPHPEGLEDKLDAPLGLLYIASTLEKEGYSVKVNDLSGISQEDWQIGSANVYGITTYVPSIKISENIAKICKEKNPSAKIVVGGAHPTEAPREMSSLFDIIVIGEGELAFLDILKDFPNNKRYYQKALEKKLDLYPNPAYHLIDPFSYKRTIGGETSLTLLTSRGCPYSCSFCGLDKSHQTVKKRSPESVAEEIKGLKEKYGIKKYNFQDDIFTIDRKRLYAMLDLFKPLDIGFRAFGRAGINNQEDFFRLKEAGCDMLAWGIESGSQKILDKMNKKSTVQDNKDVIKWAKEAGITSRSFFILGFPGETKETIEETKRFIEETNPDQFFISNFVPYPGTDVWKHPEKYGITHINKDFDNYYQVDKTFSGGANIETESLTKEEFKELELDFREWIIKRKWGGPILKSEEEIKREGLKKLKESKSSLSKLK